MSWQLVKVLLRPSLDKNRRAIQPSQGAKVTLGRAQGAACVWFPGWEMADPEAGCPLVNGASWA